MSGTMFVKDEGGWKPIGHVDESSIQITCDYDDGNVFDGYASILRDSFSCSIEMSANAIGRIFDAFYFAHRREARRLRADFARRRKLGGTRRHKGGRL